MPDATPLTSTPYALLTDAANIETAGKPGFEHLEKFAIPRYSSVSARNAAFTGIVPGTGQLTYISNNGYQGYQVWDGSQWVEFGAFTRTRTYLATNYGGANFVTNSTIFVNVTGYSVELPIGLYRVELDLHYRTAGNSTQIRTNWTFPGAQSEMTFGVIARGQEASGGGPNGSTIYNETTSSRTSGDVTEATGWNGTSEANALFAIGRGILDLKTAGTLQLQCARSGSSGNIQVDSSSVLAVTRIS